MYVCVYVRVCSSRSFMTMLLSLYVRQPIHQTRLAVYVPGLYDIILRDTHRMPASSAFLVCSSPTPGPVSLIPIGDVARTPERSLTVAQRMT